MSERITYKGIIEAAVEQCGLECIRVDDIVGAGVLDKLIYELLPAAPVWLHERGYFLKCDD